jgi:hypothetical protein
MDEDDIKTIVERRQSSSSSMTLVDIIPDAPNQPPFDVTFDRQMVDGVASPQQAGGQQPTLEIWTANSIYLVDATLACYEVIDRVSQTSDRKHKFVGTRLLGGQRKYGKTLHTTKPFPMAGTEAVFTKPSHSGQPGPIRLTSRVERIVLHVRVTTFVLDRDDAFDDVTNAMLLPNGFGFGDD